MAIALILSLTCGIPSALPAKKSSGPEVTKKPHDQYARNRKPATYIRGLRVISSNPYSGAIVIDDSTGRVLFEDNPDFIGYPASMVKMMNLLVILEAVESTHINLTDKVTVTREAARMGGSQVYLKEKEVFTVDDLLYALMVQSANDAAVALALHYKGGKKEFVALMNQRAQELGMKDTVFHSVHGLPPERGQLPDISTPRDMAKLSQAVLREPLALKYTSTTVRPFRTEAPEPFIMRTHNNLLGKFEGCDGLKTGYFRAAGYSIAATAVKNGRRAIAVVLDSENKAARDRSAARILSKGLMKLSVEFPPFRNFVSGLEVHKTGSTN